MSHVKSISTLFYPANLICFSLVFVYLSVQDLFRLRAVSRDTLVHVNEYFRRTTRLDLSRVKSNRFSWMHFCLLFKDNVSLRHLNLVNVCWIEEASFNQMISKLSRLVSVDLSNSYKISNNTLLDMALHCPLIEKLTLQHCSWLNCETFLKVIESCNHLAEIDVTSCWNLNDTCIEILFEKRGSILRRVVLSSLYSLSDRSTNAIATLATSLVYLDLSFCWRVTDLGIEYFQ